jgi:hypothetical protein
MNKIIFLMPRFYLLEGGEKKATIKLLGGWLLTN